MKITNILQDFIDTTRYQIIQVLQELYYSTRAYFIVEPCVFDYFTYKEYDGIWVNLPVIIRTPKTHNKNKMILFSGGEHIGVIDENGVEYVERKVDSDIIDRIINIIQDNPLVSKINFSISIRYERISD